MIVEMKVGETVLKLYKGDITTVAVDAIVNAANSTLLGGGGVDGAIHRAGGPAILEECRRVSPGPHGRCPTGEAVATTAGNLKAKYVIHTVGPVWSGEKQEKERLLANAYYNSLTRALEKNCRSVAFPSISTGVYRFPIEKASRIALKTVISFVTKNKAPGEIIFVLFSEKDYQVYKQLFDEEQTPD